MAELREDLDTAAWRNYLGGGQWREYLSAPFWREHAPVVAYAVCAVVVFVVAMAANFPYDDALSTMLAPLGLKLSYQDQRMSFPIGAQLIDVRLSSALQPAAPALLESDDLSLRPTIGSLLLLRPGLRINANLYQGHLSAAVHRTGSAIAVNFTADDLDLSRLRALSALGANLAGQLSATGALDATEGDLRGDTGKLTLDGKQIMIRFGVGLPPIAFSDLKGILELQNGTVKLEQIEGTGADGKLSADGTIHLGPTAASSTIALTLRLDPTQSGRSRLGFLLALLPHPPEAGPYSLNGPLLMPSIVGGGAALSPRSGVLPPSFARPMPYAAGSTVPGISPPVITPTAPAPVVGAPEAEPEATPLPADEENTDEGDNN